MKKRELGHQLGLAVCAGAALGLSTGCSIEGAPDEALESQSSEIVGGEVAEASPWAVQVFDVRGSTGDFFQCSGSLVAPRWVLTAQHCIADEGETSAVRVGSNTYGQGQRITVDAVEVPSAAADIALLHLTEDADGPFVELAEATSVATGSDATAYGWGSEGTPLVMAPSLKKAILHIDGWYSDEELLGTGVTGSGWSGDSGGPWFVDGRQVAVFSASSGQNGTNLHASLLGVDVARHRAWIDATIAGGPTVHPSNQVVLHDLSNFSGISQGFGIGRYNVADLTIIGNDRASSIRVPAGLRVTVFVNHNFEYGAYVFTSDTNLVAAGSNGVSASPNDVISSLVVSNASDPQLDVVTFYEHADFSGESFALGVGGSYLFGGPWDLRISSVRVPPGFKLTLYDGYFWTSQASRVLTADANLAPLNFDDTTRTFLIERL
ncbi:trypsin-like serine protease [Sorangium cellulosum]|uniref:Serine protease n=1 Tax=Sorangium cellulosum TaxID=56 RepID=A0A150QT07_SORCE|nr:trypsin-like serine protease [Sorangium cellulosum]KYF71094.1 serine protease [Sorangium cellulosum]